MSTPKGPERLVFKVPGRNDATGRPGGRYSAVDIIRRALVDYGFNVDGKHFSALTVERHA
jgi:hypothetical protein